MILDHLSHVVAKQFSSCSAPNADQSVYPFNDWLNNAFIFGPTVSSLAVPLADDVSDSTQQSMVDAAGTKLKENSSDSYYPRCWVALASLSLNGSWSNVAAVLFSDPTTPTTTSPASVPTAAPVTGAPATSLPTESTVGSTGELTWWTASEPGPLQGSSCEYASSAATTHDASWLSTYVSGGMYCAVSDDLFANGEGCGKCYRVTYTSGGTNDSEAQSGTADIQVVNSGAGGTEHFDCFEDAHKAITGISTGIHPVSYYEIPCTYTPPAIVILDGPNAYYTKVLVAGGTTGVAGVDIILDGNRVTMYKNSGATWAAGLSGTEGTQVDIAFEVTFTDNTVVLISSCFGW